MRLKLRGQSIMEYAIVIIIILAVFLTMKMYMKRGIQGRWKQAVDDFGDQYDPRYVNSSIIHTMESTSNTTISIAHDNGGYYTNRIDESIVRERQIGDTRLSQEGNNVW